MLLVSVLEGLFFYGMQFTRIEGLLLAVLYLLYIINMARAAEKRGSDCLTQDQLSELPKDGSFPVACLWLLLAFIIMPIATRMIMDNATVLAHFFHLGELTIGLTVVAIGTSLAELATAITGARKGEDDIAIGNIIGSNIFNIAIVIGLPALISPGSFSPAAFSQGYLVTMAISMIFALLCWHFRRISRRREPCLVLVLSRG